MLTVRLETVEGLSRPASARCGPACRQNGSGLGKKRAGCRDRVVAGDLHVEGDCSDGAVGDRVIVRMLGFVVSLEPSLPGL